LGADLGNMTEAWWCPALSVPSERYDEQPLYRAEFGMRQLPHSILVNRAGRRFVNEAANYNDLCKTMFHFDPVTYTRPNVPCWLVMERRFVERYRLVDRPPGAPRPGWVLQGDTLAAVAAAAGIDAEGLAETVSRFNRAAAQGRDPELHRGESAFD